MGPCFMLRLKIFIMIFRCELGFFSQRIVFTKSYNYVQIEGK